jgi:hypothetical protein
MVTKRSLDASYSARNAKHSLSSPVALAVDPFPIVELIESRVRERDPRSDNQPSLPAFTGADLDALVGNALALAHAARALAAVMTASTLHPTRARAAVREAHARAIDCVTSIEVCREVLLARGAR